MVNKMQAALIRKELRGVVQSSSFFTNYLLLPLMFAVVFPVGAVLLVNFVDVTEFTEMAALIGIDLTAGGMEIELVGMMIDNLMPTFFLMIPPLIVTAIAAASFTGEKERRTLETLLYSPMSLRQIFSAKVLASLLVGMIVVLISFTIMTLAVGGLVWVLMGELFIPGWIWVVVIGLVAPAFAFLAIILQVRISAKAKSSEEAFQRGGVIVLPLVMLLLSQVTGILLLSPLVYTILGFVLVGLGWGLMRLAFRKFTYEELLK